MECRTVALIALYVFVGFIIYIWLAIPPGTDWDGKVVWGDIATWAGAISSTSAVVAALWLASDARRREDRRDGEIASIIATALCDELRGNRSELERARGWLTEGGLNLEQRTKLLRDALASIDITAFRLFRNELRSLGPDRGEAVATVYASLARCKALEKHVSVPEAGAEFVSWAPGYLANRRDACEDIEHEACRAILLLWPITREPVGVSAPMTNEEEAVYSEKFRAARG